MLVTLAVTLGLGGGAIGCASKLEKARGARSAGDAVKAEELYRASIEKDPDDAAIASRELVDLKVDVGRKLVKAKDGQGAEQVYREALQIDGRSEKAIDGLGRALAAQQRFDEAIQILGGESEFGACGMCKRYLAVQLLNRAHRREEDGNHEGAKDDYAKAQSLIPDVETGFAIARTHVNLGDEKSAADAVELAASLITDSDTRSQELFAKTRQAAVERALRAGDIALADRYLLIFPPGSGGEAWYTLQLRVAQEQWRKRDATGAIARVEPLLGEKHADALPEIRRAQFEKFIAKVYQGQGATLMGQGKPAEADEWFKKAMDLQPDNETLKLQRALAFAGRGQVEAGLKLVASTTDKAKGRDEIQAIIESMNVHRLLEDGDLDGAKDALTRAQASSYEAPETHIAAAEILAQTPIPGVSKKAKKILKKTGVANYPDGEINKYGEALSEIAWARTQVENQGERYPYRGPDFEQRAKALEQRIRAFYPYDIKFNEDGNTIIEASSNSGGKDVLFRGPNGFEGGVFVKPGKTATVTVPQPGLVTWKVGKDKFSFYSEPYTHVLLKL